MDDLHDVETVGDSPEARFGAVLRRVRVQAGVSVRRLAKDLDRAHSTISDFENGRRLAGVEVVEQYEDYFGLARGTLGAQRERARAERLEAPRDATVDENLGDVVCPYMGLRAFEYDDAGLFFGREAQVRDVLARLEETRFVAVLGASGSGKSSFVRAGLLAGISTAATNGGPRARVAVLTPGEHPLAALATALNAATRGSTPVTPDVLRDDPDRLWRVARGAGEGAVVIVVDQLEELFTLCADEIERRCFVDALVAAWREPSSRVVVIVALRADFYGRVAAYPELAAAVVAHQALIGPMSPAELRRAIELPAADCGLLLQPGLTDTMLEDLGDEPGALPLLSHALLETWKRRRRLMLSVGGYREAGGVRGAIAQTAEHTLQRLSGADQQIARLIFLSLTDIGEGAEPTRRRVDRADLAVRVDPSQRDRVLAVLADARLVTLDESTVTVAHEALIRHWPRLRGWIDTDRAGLLTHRRLTQAAREWDTLQRETGALYRGARLAAVRDWAADHAEQLSSLERDFLSASRRSERHELENARSRTRRLRVLSGGLAGLTTIVAVLAVWALDQRAGARREARQATSLALASAATPLLNSRPDVSLLLALEGYRASARVEARSSVLAALARARGPGVLAILHGHTDAVGSVAFSPDGRTLASAAADSTVRLWDARRHKQRGEPLNHRESPTGVRSVAFSPNGGILASGSADRAVRLWDVHRHKQRGQPLKARTGGARSVAFSPDGRTLASAGVDSTIGMWDADSHKPLGQPLRGHTSAVNSIAFSPDGNTLASASTDNTIRLWNAHTHKPLGQPLRGHTSAVNSIAFSPDGNTLASASTDNTIRLWNAHTHKPLGQPLRGHTSAVNSIAFSPDGNTLASASTDNTIRLWNAHTHKPLGQPLRGHTSAVNSIAFSPDGNTLASASTDNTIRLWNARDHRARGHTDAVRSVAFSPHGRTLASASADSTIRLWNADTHKPLGRPLRGHTNPVNSIAFSPDGRTLASASTDNTIRLWNAHTHKPLGRPLRGHTNPVNSIAFSPDGRTLASASTDNTIRLWNAHTHKPLGRPLRGHTNPVNSIAFSPDGRTLASASTDSTIRLWDVRNHKQRGAGLIGHASAVNSIAFSPDGRTLASAGVDKAIRLWDLRTHASLGAPLTGHTRAVSSVAFSPDGRTLASSGADRTIRLWDVHARKPLGAPLTGDADTSVAFSSDARTLAFGGNDATVHVWENILWDNVAELQREVCNLVGTGLSETEWAQHAAGIAYRKSCP